MRISNFDEPMRQASHFTMNGLMDPRLLQPISAVQENVIARMVSLMSARMVTVYTNAVSLFKPNGNASPS